MVKIGYLQLEIQRFLIERCNSQTIVLKMELMDNNIVFAFVVKVLLNYNTTAKILMITI
jgi:hypothetical protein